MMLISSQILTSRVITESVNLILKQWEVIASLLSHSEQQSHTRGLKPSTVFHLTWLGVMIDSVHVLSVPCNHSSLLGHSGSLRTDNC